MALCGRGGHRRGLPGPCGRAGRHPGGPGSQKHAKTDRSDARLLRELLQAGDLSESWIPPEAVLEWRERVRLYKTLLDQRRMWIQRIHAELFQHGVSVPEGQIASSQTRDWLTGEGVALDAAARQRITAGYLILDATDTVRLPLRADLERSATPAGLQSLDRRPLRDRPVDRGRGVGRARRLSALQPVAAGGPPHRPGRDRGSVRPPRGRGYLSRQGPETLRWALFEAGMAASRATSPDRAYYRRSNSPRRQDRRHLEARKLARRATHPARWTPTWSTPRPRKPRHQPARRPARRPNTRSAVADSACRSTCGRL